MTTDREALSTWTRHDQGDDPGRSHGTPVKYRCVSCDWRGKGSIARAEHWRETQHVVIDADDPRFGVYARFAFDWTMGDTTMRMYTVYGGLLDRSTVTADTLINMGIPVRS